MHAVYHIQEVNAIADLIPEPRTKLPLWEHQREAYEFAYPKASTMLAMAMGTGKSAVAAALIGTRGHRITLIVAPASVVKSVWPKQLETHANAELIVCAPSGNTSQRAAKFKQAVDRQKITGKPLVLCINYEAVWRDACTKFLYSLSIDFLILDESHRIKNPNGTASKFLSRLSKRIPYKLALTGTPMPHSPLDLFAQYRVLDQSIFGQYVTHFRTKYAVVGSPGADGKVRGQAYDPKTATELMRKGYRIALNPGKENEFREKFYSIAYRVDNSILDLPETVHITRSAELGKEAGRTYREMKNLAIAEIRNGTITASNARVKLLRLQQITGGCVNDDDGTPRIVGHEKRDLLEDIVRDIAPGEPLVVFCRFTHDLASVKHVAETGGRRYAELSGRINELAAWQDSKADVLGVQIQSGGVGIDLTRARYAIYYSIGYSLGDYEQSLARVHRPGQTRTVMYIHLVMENTVDEDVYEALRQRKEIIEHVMGVMQDGK